MLILGIETSCDETAAAVVETNGQRTSRILSSVVASQNDVHAPYGGVVPELASRRHMEMCVPIMLSALKRAKKSLKDIDGIAVTHAPGLLGSLLVGIQFAKGLALALSKPLIAVNHLEGHLNAIALEKDAVPYPHTALLISGGHTSLYLVSEFGKYRLLGGTRDDAAGEAFDKVAKLLGLGYPGGPMIEKAASQGNPNAVKFKHPNFNPSDKFQISDLDFSFSGIKTAVLLHYKKTTLEGKITKKYIADIAASFQEAVIRFLCLRAFEALEQTKVRTVVLCGGVAANKPLRSRLEQKCRESSAVCLIPSMHLCTDNAAMIAYVGGEYLKMGKTSDMGLNAAANLEIGLECATK